MDMEKMLVDTLMASIKKEYTHHDAPAFFKISLLDIQETLHLIENFTKINETFIPATLDKQNLEALISFVTQSSIFETYVNEMVAPFVSASQKSSLSIFKEGIQQLASVQNIEENNDLGVEQMTLMLMPTPLACTLIISAYLTLVDYEGHLSGSLDDLLEQLDIEAHNYLKLYDIILQLLIRPIAQILEYHQHDMDRGIPMLFIISLGTLNAKAYEEKNHGLMDQIEMSIKATIDQIQQRFHTDEEVVN